MAIPKPPKAVTFDCWSTLISDNSWEQTRVNRQERLIEIAGRHGVMLHPERARELIQGSWDLHVDDWRSGGFFGAPGAARWIATQLPELPEEATQDEDFVEELILAIEEATEGVGTHVIEGAAEAVEAVRAAGIPTALVCDVGFTPNRFVRQFLKEHHITLDHYFFSDELGVPKPYPPIFNAALKATGASPAEAVHIGDLRRTDIAGARNVGMGTIRFIGVHNDQWESEDTSGEEADLVLERWAELPGALGI
jgi:putative hydrolase of the HAD superfamily